jgi:hypothetical protein
MISSLVLPLPEDALGCIERIFSKSLTVSLFAVVISAF